MTSTGQLDGMVKKLEWLLGKWSSEDGQGVYPTNQDFRFGEEVEFFHSGQPNIQFSFSSWHLETFTPLQREVGFLRMKHNSNKVAMIVSQSSGMCEIDEGVVNGQELTLESHTLASTTFQARPSDTKKVRRVFKREGDILVQTISIETPSHPMMEHSKVQYLKKD